MYNTEERGPAAMQAQRLVSPHEFSFSNEPPTSTVNNHKPFSVIKILWYLVGLIPVGVGVLVVVLGEYYHIDWLIQMAVQSLFLWLVIYIPLWLNKIESVDKENKAKGKKSE